MAVVMSGEDMIAEGRDKVVAHDVPVASQSRILDLVRCVGLKPLGGKIPETDLRDLVIGSLLHLGNLLVEDGLGLSLRCACPGKPFLFPVYPQVSVIVIPFLDYAPPHVMSPFSSIPSNGLGSAC